MHDLVYLAGVFSWAAKSPPSLCLNTCAFLILLVVFCSENITCSKKNNLKINPLEEKPHNASLADGARHCFTPGSRYPTATTVPSMAFPGHPICSVLLCPWSRMCWCCLHLSPQMLAPAGCFVSVALLPDLSCFLPCGCNWRKSQHIGCVPAAVTGWGQHCGSLCPGICSPWR